MLVDFALDVERHEGASPEDSIYKALYAAVSADPDDDDGGAVRRRTADARAAALDRRSASHWGYTIVGGLILSQLLTLFTTPVVYIYLDRLQAFLRRSREPSKKANAVA